jgi:hypothetical protein
MENQNKNVIVEVSKKEFAALAKSFGKITLGETKYFYINSQDALIKQDLIKKYTEHIEQRKSWKQFLEIYS